MWQAVILGIVQGLTEFLPVSSSAHLLLLPWLMGWSSMGLSFDVMLHLGTLLALLTYFRREWLNLFREFLNRIFRASESRPESRRLVDALILGTLPAVGVIVAFSDLIQNYFRNPMVTVVTLAVFGMLLWAADRWSDHSRHLGSLLPSEGLIIGCAQALALIPGVSRSGITVTAALLLGLSRSESARFSFMLSTPVVAFASAASAYDLYRSTAEPVTREALAAGIMLSFLSGLLCIKYFLRFLATRTYFPFVVYRLLLAAFIFVWLVS
ncbi:MAG: undecaprenyl-diphosphatase UppP [Acidobacteria bacterium]|nr:undecaprenyl-diphosphatase UppP [Acidobacteriota bacterium]